jgi:hypothetical protein
VKEGRKEGRRKRPYCTTMFVDGEFKTAPLEKERKMEGKEGKKDERKEGKKGKQRGREKKRKVWRYIIYIVSNLVSKYVS